jgi:F0F1-type ATP synthase assembly protein I
MIKNLLSAEPEPQAKSKQGASRSGQSVLGLFDPGEPDNPESRQAEDFVLSQAEPESMAETVRRSGLAWSAGIAFVAAVVFMLILGWGADVLLGTSPWGIVAGILLGSIIGFVQLFRITSQIFKK